MKHVWLIYSGGIPNYGDEMIARVWVDFLTQKYGGEVSIYLDTPNPSMTANFFLGDRNVKVVNTFWQITRNVKEHDFSERYQLLEEFVTQKTEIIQRFSIDFILKNVDAIHFIGGGYLNDIWDNSVTVDLAVILKEKSKRVKLFGTGLGLLPANEEYSKHYKKLFDKFDFIEARDEHSAKAFSVLAGIDDMWLAFADRAKLQSVKVHKQAFPDIMLNMQEDFNQEHLDDLIGTMVELVKKHPKYKKDKLIGIAEAYPKRDQFLHVEIQKRLPNPIRRYTLSDILLDGFPANQKTFWVTTRFHFHLIASALGSKGVALTSGSEYYDVKHESLINLGTGWKMLDITTNKLYQKQKQDLTNASLTKLEVATMLYERLNF